MLPRSLAQYVFARHAFGSFAGFLVGWLDWISACASIGNDRDRDRRIVAKITGTTAGVAAPVAMSVVVIFTLLLLRGRSRVTSPTKSRTWPGTRAGAGRACFVFGGCARATAGACGGNGGNVRGVHARGAIGDLRV
jgi:hypothetical protein